MVVFELRVVVSQFTAETDKRRVILGILWDRFGRFIRFFNWSVHDAKTLLELSLPITVSNVCVKEFFYIHENVRNKANLQRISTKYNLLIQLIIK